MSLPRPEIGGGSETRTHILVAGGGAAGFFAAIAAAETLAGRGGVTLCEATAHPLAKVRISGGGRCNVTHACFDPLELSRRYPRGGKELLGTFHRFGPRETVAWFESRGVTLKTEADGRMFPTTDDSATIIDCLMRAASEAGVILRIRCGISEVRINEGGASRFRVILTSGETVNADRVVLATGGLKPSAHPAPAQALGHTLEPPVPSLFTFHIDDERLRGLSGLSVADVATSLPGMRMFRRPRVPERVEVLRERGPLLITHTGLSGPAVLTLSAWGARELAACGYRFTLGVNFAPEHTWETARRAFFAERSAHPKKQVSNGCPLELPARLWERLLAAAGLRPGLTWSQASNDVLGALAQQIVAAEFAVTGKSLNKEEFVTCGGVRLSEVDFRTLESRICPGLFLAGEILDIDGVTGGFNFQAAWSTGWLAGHAAADRLRSSVVL